MNYKNKAPAIEKKSVCILLKAWLRKNSVDLLFFDKAANGNKLFWFFWFKTLTDGHLKVQPNQAPIILRN